MIVAKKRLVRISQDIRTIGGAAFMLSCLAAGVYSLWPLPKTVAAQGEELLESRKRDTKQDEKIEALCDIVKKSASEQRILIASLQEDSKITREVMLKLLEKINGN